MDGEEDGEKKEVVVEVEEEVVVRGVCMGWVMMCSSNQAIQ